MLPKLTTSEIVALRPEVKRPTQTTRPLDVTTEWEPADKSRESRSVGTVFMVGSECRFHCLMCDLWKYTTTAPTGADDIIAQVRYGVERLSAVENPPSWIKLYNASNFFSTANVPKRALAEIAKLVRHFDRVIVENHPKLTTDAILDFSAQIDGTLELAQGLETCHPPTLELLNKSMTTDDYRRACDWAQQNGVDVRAFVLLRPPGMSEEEGLQWCIRSIEFAQECGCRHVSVIPLRSGNGAIEHLQSKGQVGLPRLQTLERLMQQVAAFRTIVTADLWDWDALQGHCAACSEPRRKRLRQANLQQVFPAEPIRRDERCRCDVL